MAINKYNRLKRCRFLDLDPTAVGCFKKSIRTNVRKGKISETVSTVYWLLATAIYLCWSFMTNDWQLTWVVWPVAGVLFAGVKSLCNLLLCKDE